MGEHASNRDPGEPAQPDIRAVFSAERTLLAWIRTGVALMGFGFVVARFAIYLRELADARHAVPLRHSDLSLWAGSLLVLLGVAVNLFATFNYAAIVRALRRSQSVPWHGLSMGIAATTILTIVGLAMVVYLLLVGRG